MKYRTTTDSGRQSLSLKAKIRYGWSEWCKPFLIIFIVLATFRSAIADWNDVPTGSMRPTILEGDRVFVNKLAYGLRVPFTRIWLTRWDQPDRGEVVICFSPEDGKRLVKRIIGLPGDTVALRNNVLYINGKACEYSDLDQETIDQIDKVIQSQHDFSRELLDDCQHPVMFTPHVSNAKRNFAAFVVPEGEYFVMGDNRDASYDSRYYGCIERKQFIGQAVAIAFSLDYDNWYIPRWGRFFHSLP